MDPELLLRVGKPEKYVRLPPTVAHDVGPDNTGLFLEYSPILLTPIEFPQQQPVGPTPRD